MACRAELVQLDQKREEFRRRGIDVLGIAFDPVDRLRQLRLSEGLQIGLASDPDERLAKALGLVHENVWRGKDAFYPTKILIDNADDRVLWVHGEDDLRVRSGPEAVLEAIDRVLK